MKHLKKRKSKRVDGKVRKAIKAKAKEKRKKSKKLRMQGKRPKKDLDVPNLWPWKAEMLQNKLNRMKEHDAEELRRKQTQRKQQLKKRRTDMLLKAISTDVAMQEEAKPKQRSQGDGPKNKKWFRRELMKVVETADVIIEVLDARDPIGCRCEAIEQRVVSMKSTTTTRPKKLILLLNKIDLVPSDVLRKWIRVLRRDFPVVAFKCNTQTQKKNLSQSNMNFKGDVSSTSQSVGSEALLQLLKNYSRSLNLKTSITVGFIGYPNTGKSSVINSLKRTRMAGTSSTPGFTTSLQEVRLDANIKLLDSPGVLLNMNDDPTALVLKNAIRIDDVDGISAVGSILQRCPWENLTEVYQLPEFNNAEEFLFLVAQNRGKLKKGGVPDMQQASRMVLMDWTSGKIPFYVAPPTEEDKNDETNVVSSFSDAFDLDALLKSNYENATRATEGANAGKKFVELRSTVEKEDEEMVG